MKKKLLFFTEYSKKIGKGHFYRTKQVFNKVSKKNNFKLFINKNYKFINNILKKYKSDLVIYDFKKYSNKLFKHKTKFIAFDNNKKYHEKLININPLRLSSKNYSGPEWYPYPSNFFQIKKKKRQNKYSLLIVQGATDAFNNLEKIIKCINFLDPKKFKECIIKTPKKIKINFKKINNIKIKQLTSVKKISELYKKIDLAISGCGNTSYELSFFGIPCVLVSSEKTEISRGKYLQKKGFSKFYKPDRLKDISSELNKLSNNFSYYKKIRKKNINFFKKDGLRNTSLLIDRIINEV